jgi:hypothetical protein
MAYYIIEDDEYKGYEVFNLKEGLGEIILYGDERESLICFSNKPVAFVWPDFGGSVAQLLSRTVSYYDYKDTLEKIRQVVEQGKKYDDVPLSETLYGLLTLFEKGQYLIGEYQIDDYELFDVKQTISSPFNYYPWGWSFIMTKPKNKLNEFTIQEHMEKIQNGKKLKVIITSVYGNGTLYVLDGHHKLEAYKRLNVYPHIIEIVSVLSKPLNLEIGCSMLKNYSKVIYKKLKKEYMDDSSKQNPIDLNSECILESKTKLKGCIGKYGL